MRYSRVEVATAGLLAVICVGIVYEAAIALEWISIGTAPGEGAAHQGLVLSTTELAILTGIAVTIATNGRNRLIPLLAPAAAAFMVARFYTFDPYYAPTLRRASDQGGFSPIWVWTLAALAMSSATLSLARPRLGFLNAPVMLLCAFTAWVVYFGH
jgi:hypothetical protein